MSQYSSFLAAAPALQVLKRTSSPESIRQFGNPSQLAKPWFIFRRPSETRYTPQKEVQQLAESHDDSIASVMSSTNLECVLHEEIDCVVTTAAEEITAAEVPKIILYEQTNTRSSTDVPISEPSTNPELMFEASGSSNADIDYVTTTASEEITAAEIPEIILYEQTDIRSSTDVPILGQSTNLEPISKVSEFSNEHVDSVFDFAILEQATEPEPIDSVLQSSSEHVDSVLDIAAETTHPRLPTNPEHMPSVLHTDICSVATTTSQEIILYEQIDNRSSTDVIIFELFTNPELSECLSQHVNFVSDIGIIGPSTNTEPTLKASKLSCQHVDSVSDISSAETAHLNISTNPDPIPSVSYASIDSVATATSPEIILYDPIDIRSSTDVTIFESHPELIKISESSSQHVSDISSAEKTNLKLSTNPALMPAVSHADINCDATTVSPDLILYEPIDIRSSTDVTISEPSTSPKPIFKIPECSNQHVDSVSGISSAETIHLNLFTNPEHIPSASHADINCVETILYEQIDIRPSADGTIFKPSTILRSSTNLELSELSSQHVDSVSDIDIASAETTHLRLSKNPEPMRALSHADIDCVATKTEEITATEVFMNPETIPYEQIDSRSSTDVTILGPSTIFKVSECSSQRVGSVSDIAIIGLSTNLELIDSASENSRDRIVVLACISAETTHLKVSTNPDPMPAVSHVDSDSVATMTDEVITVKVPTIPKIILDDQIDTCSSINVTIFGPYTNPELVDCASDIASGDTTYLKVSTKLESMPEVCVSTKTDAIPAVKIYTSLEIMPYEPMEICSSIDHVSYAVPPVTINALTSAKTSEKCCDDNSSMQIAAPTPATKLEPIRTVPALTRQKTERHSNAQFSELTPVTRSSKFSNQDIDFGSNTTDNPKSKTIGIGRSNTLLESTKSKLIDPVRPTSQSSGRPVQLAAIAANTSRPRSRSSLPITPQVPQRPATRSSPPAKSALPKKFGSSRFAGSILHLPTADEDEARRRHALINGRLARAPKVGISVRPPGAGIKRIPGRGKMVQERVGSNATLAVMTEVVEEEEEVAECNPIPTAEKGEKKVEEKVVEEERGAAISRSVENSGAWPFSRSRNVRRKAIVWRKLDNITEEEGEADEPVALVAQCEPAAATQQDLEEAPIVDGEEEGGVSVETPSPEDKGEEPAEVGASTGIGPVEAAAPRPIPYPVPSRWSSRIGEMRVPRRPSYNWEMACSSDVTGPEPVYVERVRYPAPMRWSSRIGEVKRARTLGYAGFPPPAENPEPEVLGAPEGAVPTLGGGETERGLPVFFGEAGIVPQQEGKSSSGEWRENQGAGAKRAGSLRRYAKQAWKKIGRVFSGGRG